MCLCAEQPEWEVLQHTFIFLRNSETSISTCSLNAAATQLNISNRTSPQRVQTEQSSWSHHPQTQINGRGCSSAMCCGLINLWLDPMMVTLMIPSSFISLLTGLNDICRMATVPFEPVNITHMPQWTKGHFNKFTFWSQVWQELVKSERKKASVLPVRQGGPCYLLEQERGRPEHLMWHDYI